MPHGGRIRPGRRDTLGPCCTLDARGSHELAGLVSADIDPGVIHFTAFKIGRVGYLPGMAKEQSPSLGLQAIGLVGCVFSIGFLLLLLVPGSPGALGMPSLIALGAWLLAGIAFFFVRRRVYITTAEVDLYAAVFR